MFETDLPSAANIFTVFWVFALMLLGFHLATVWPRNLSKKAWKRVDYLWLGFAALGLIGASGNVRIHSAESELSITELRIANYYDLYRNLLESYARDDGAICRLFVRAEFSPPEPELSQTQAQFDRVCAWIKQTEKSSPKTLAKDGEGAKPFEPITPMPTDGTLSQILQDIEKQQSYFLDEAAIHKKLQIEAKPSDTERTLNFLGPWLLAFALAIRIAKVSGELRFEK
ncbi:hypothetical protein [Pseudomonas coronafaciens]|uniref:hypothetical protein n=1 Tax=Pseudomonas coronafaciens TaxID=53409 RepID=UPI001F2D1608|nr:hypothetical protein [Pseudomonas coronafaciens]